MAAQELDPRQPGSGPVLLSSGLLGALPVPGSVLDSLHTVAHLGLTKLWANGVWSSEWQCQGSKHSLEREGYYFSAVGEKDWKLSNHGEAF